MSALLLMLGLGCVRPWPHDPEPRVTTLSEPVGAQLARLVPPLRDERFSLLLDFESDADGVFVSARPPGRMVVDRAHTGARSLRLEPSTERVTIKLASLLSGRPFPADWTLLGAYFYSEAQIEIELVLEGMPSASSRVRPRKVTLPASTWTGGFVDLVPLAALATSASDIEGASLVITVPHRDAPVWLDDVLLINNSRQLVRREPPPAVSVQSGDRSEGSSASASADELPVPLGRAAERPAAVQGWSITRAGLSYLGESPGRFNFSLLTVDATRNGWEVEEANVIRARFRSTGSAKHLTVYPDGRAYQDGELKPMSAPVRDSLVFLEQHRSPAELAVPEELGRVDRNTEGDANNDGYNERRGSYEIDASGSRVQVLITPRTAAMQNVVMEIRGLPAGPVLATSEGRLIPRVVRLDDGTVLVELAARLARPTTVDVRLQ